ncbi:hypothetical protein Nm8I071_04740 [Nonomuraea sp. TT08I-71]|nr:hypothetical protein Nm8I071_04740 [Nonomuraea sp. TT08I-71]
MTATFSTPSGEVKLTIPDDGGAIVNNLGTSKAWIRVPAGWTLTDATAVISGTASEFVLTHTCAASNPPVRPELTLTKTGSPASGLKAGDVVTYTYTVKNDSTGAVTITDLDVTDDTVTGVTCTDTTLDPGESTTCTGKYTVTNDDVKNGKIVNTAQASGKFGEQIVPSNEATFTVTTVTPPPVQASLSIDKKARVESRIDGGARHSGVPPGGAGGHRARGGDPPVGGGCNGRPPHPGYLCVSAT